MNWDQYFMTLVYLISTKSKDQKTKHGAIIVASDKGVRSTGYNSFPREINDDIQERQERPEKYFWFEHAERNAIYNAAKSGIKLDGCIIYTAGIPCMDCARAIVQAGIKKVIVHKSYVDSQKTQGYELWNEHARRTITLFNEASVILEFFDGDIIRNIVGMRNGEPI